MKKGREEIQAITDHVAASISAIRKEHGLSILKLAELAGVTQTGLSYVEKGARKPTLHYLLQVCKALEIELWPLLKEAEKAVSKATK